MHLISERYLKQTPEPSSPIRASNSVLSKLNRLSCDLGIFFLHLLVHLKNYYILSVKKLSSIRIGTFQKNLKHLSVKAMYSYVVWLFVIFLNMAPIVHTEECPPWFRLKNITGSLIPQCVCSTTQQYKISCNQVKQESSLTLGYCAFEDTATNGTVVAACPYVFPKHLIVNYHIPLPRRVSELNSFMCSNLNRNIGSYLCGRCANGTGPANVCPAVQSTFCTTSSCSIFPTQSCSWLS